MQRDPIYAALLEQLQQLQAPPYNVLTVSRGFVTWDACNDQPAIFIVPKTEKGKYVMGLPTEWTITLDLYVYVRWTDSVLQGVSDLAKVMDGIEAILSPVGVNAGQAEGFVNTLGGLVDYCALQGEADISGGYLNGSQTVARMPVEIIVA